MQSYTITDDYNRRTTFVADKLVNESTDSEDGRKPQWTDLTIWHTEAGQYVVQREVKFRIRHQDVNCLRAYSDGASLRAALESDTFPCPSCNNHGKFTGGLGQGFRTTIVVYRVPEDLIAGLSTINNQNGLKHHSHFAQAVLADLSEQDEAVAQLWMNQVVD